VTIETLKQPRILQFGTVKLSWAESLIHQLDSDCPMVPSSESETLDNIRPKMREYTNNGRRLDWLIIPKEQ
jgi:hypothetical protein